MRQAREIVRLPSGGALHACGPARSAPILFLHGVGGGAWSWEPQLVALEPDYRCYAWEARGHGLARRVNDAGLADYYADALEALATVANGGPAFVAGHSMGGLLALALAAERPHSVRGCVLIDPVYAPAGAGHAGSYLAHLARRAVGPLVASLERDGRAGRAVARRVFAGAFVDRRCRERAWRRQRTQVPVEYPRMMYEAFDGPAGFPNRAFAREIGVPALLLEPASGAPRFPDLIAELSALGQRFTHRMLEGGHYLQLDRTADAVTHAVREFVTAW